MSVIVKGMEMPKVCAECFMDPPCCKALSGDTNIWKERHPDCPLVEVKEPHWIPVTERTPRKRDHKDDMVLVCNENGSIRFNTCINGTWVYGDPIAWMPLPEPMRMEKQ